MGINISSLPYRMPISAVALGTSGSAQARRQAMIDRVLPGPKVVRNSLWEDGARPLKILRDPAQPLGSTNPLIDLKVGGLQQYVEPARPCERTPVINTTSAGQWLYTMSRAGQRGIALCK